MTEIYHAMAVTGVVLLALSIVLYLAGEESRPQNKRKLYVASFTCLFVAAAFFIASAWTAVLT
jgi:hypothetical protein